ncbi:MAG: recombinase RecA [Bdellovibrionaceae bacterium]|nr:recombinase RecA [Pseudobdellovibrionaceae bacterium]MDW8189559.1 recombinase RecA [Pseudobdellovibrionaceae bacterium]
METQRLTNQERMKALELALGTIEKQFGKGSIMRLGADQSLNKDVEVISTGSLALDVALGIGGLPKGRIVEIFGPESSGKTTIALSVCAQAQKKGGVVAYIDAEHALDVNYAKKLGVNIEDLLISQPDTGEQALEIAETLVRSGAIDVLVVDSVAALVPRAELEGEMGDSHMGLQARLMSQALRKLTAAISRSKTLCIFINQIRMKIGVMFGNPETTTGGNALKFYSSIRLDVRRVGAIKNGEDIVGSRTAVKVVKNKMAPPFTKVEFDLMYHEGISLEGDILDLAVTAGFIDKSGAWYSYQNERIGQGRDQAKQFLKDNPKVAEELRSRILAANGIGKLLLTNEGTTDHMDDGSIDRLDSSPHKKGGGTNSGRESTKKSAKSSSESLVM